jgi:hypothetical protein
VSVAGLVSISLRVFLMAFMPGLSKMEYIRAS